MLSECGPLSVPSRTALVPYPGLVPLAAHHEPLLRDGPDRDQVVLAARLRPPARALPRIPALVSRGERALIHASQQTMYHNKLAVGAPRDARERTKEAAKGHQQPRYACSRHPVRFEGGRAGGSLQQHVLGGVKVKDAQESIAADGCQVLAVDREREGCIERTITGAFSRAGKPKRQVGHGAIRTRDGAAADLPVGNRVVLLRLSMRHHKPVFAHGACSGKD